MALPRQVWRALLFTPLVTAVGCSAGSGPASSAPAPAATTESIPSQFNRYYLEGPGKEERVFAGKWLGVPIAQNPADLAMYQEIVSEVRPDIVIETGTWYGGLALYFASLLEQVNPEAKVLTVDLEPKLKQSLAAILSPAMRAQLDALVARRIEVFTSDCMDPKLIETLTQKTQGKKVLVVLDTDHCVDHVARELRLYAPLVSPASYLIVHDTIQDDRAEWVEAWTFCPKDGRQGGPGLAVDEFLREHKNFQADRARERFLLSWSPRGYLKRMY